LCFWWIQSWKRKFLESTNHFGCVLGERKIHLVYGGGNLGLMGSVSTTVFLGGSQVLGVIPKALAKMDLIGKTVGRGTGGLHNV
jgi:predicted Rossmann-fold nucleotide-binding protein